MQAADLMPQAAPDPAAQFLLFRTNTTDTERDLSVQAVNDATLLPDIAPCCQLPGHSAWNLAQKPEHLWAAEMRQQLAQQPAVVHPSALVTTGSVNMACN